LVGVYKKLWADLWGPRLEYLLRNAILALLEYPSSTLLGVNRLFIDKEYRSKVLEKVSDPVVKTFWTDEFTKYHDRLLSDAIAPIQNKVGQFLSSSPIRNIVGQTKSAFNVREIMDEEKILIMNLSKGKIGEDNSVLLGAMMIMKVQLAVMARVDIPEADRKDFYLYVDEFQNFASESFAGILSEARKYRLNLILAHQFISQLDETVRDAIFGNVGTLVTFKIGAMDSEVLEKEFEPTFYANDLANLAKYNLYLKLMIDGVAANPFSATSLPPIDLSETEENVDKVINNSREKYGSAREVVEDRINRWSGIVKPGVASKISELAKQQTTTLAENAGKKQSPVAEQESVSQSGTNTASQSSEVETKVVGPSAQAPSEELGRTLHIAECSGCGDKVEVPFEPDGKRPVFCKECLNNYRRQQSELQKQLQEKEIPVSQQSNQTQKDSVQSRSASENKAQTNKQDQGSMKRHATATDDLRRQANKTSNSHKVEVDKGAVRDLIAKAMKGRDKS